jgi:hypothetical protein
VLAGAWETTIYASVGVSLQSDRHSHDFLRMPLLLRAIAFARRRLDCLGPKRQIFKIYLIPSRVTPNEDRSDLCVSRLKVRYGAISTTVSNVEPVDALNITRLLDKPPLIKHCRERERIPATDSGFLWSVRLNLVEVEVNHVSSQHIKIS